MIILLCSVVYCLKQLFNKVERGIDEKKEQRKVRSYEFDGIEKDELDDI